MTWIEALIIGLIQGITEILPISSTAHILLLADVLNVSKPSIAATVFLNFGSF
ncbi:MAG: undecaprenyl-diphosphate phosphatase, partial [Candidatus Paceibacteria bacterium]